MATWIQFGTLLLAIIYAAMRGERRITRIETKVDAMWQAYFEPEKHADG
jgi:hypothetical protein